MQDSRVQGLQGSREVRKLSTLNFGPLLFLRRLNRLFLALSAFCLLGEAYSKGRLVHFLLRKRKRTKRRRPVSRSILRVVAAVGAHGNSPRFQRDSNSPRAFIRPPRRCAARNKGGLTPKPLTAKFRTRLSGKISFQVFRMAVFPPRNCTTLSLMQ